MTAQLESSILAREDTSAPNLYFVTNRLNLLEVLSSRFIAPRASYGKYYSDLLEVCPGRVPLVTAPIASSLVDAVASDTELFPVAIEIDASNLNELKAPALESTGRTRDAGVNMNTLAWAPEFVVPLSWCRRVAFRSADELREHVARKYENVPEHSLPQEVDASIFASSNTRELLEWFKNLPASRGPSAADFRVSDRVSGARCVSLAVLPYAPRAASVALTLLRSAETVNKKAKRKRKSDTTGDTDAAWISIAAIQGSVSANASLDEKLFSAVSKALLAADKSGGWKPVELIDKVALDVRSTKLARRDEEELAKNLEAIRAVISNERDFRPFKKATGSDAAKAFLLFLMRRDPAKLIAWPLQETGADDAVMMTAAVFAGLFSGRSRLPLSMRPAITDAALADLSALELSRHVPAAQARLAATQVESREESDEQGRVSHAITLDGTELARWTPPPPSLAERLAALDFTDGSNAAMAVEVCRLLNWPDSVRSTFAIDSGEFAVKAASRGKGALITAAGWPRVETDLNEGVFRGRLSNEEIPQERVAHVERLLKESKHNAD
jgi:hypothetical protein